MMGFRDRMIWGAMRPNCAKVSGCIAMSLTFLNLLSHNRMRKASVYLISLSFSRETLLGVYLNLPLGSFSLWEVLQNRGTGAVLETITKAVQRHTLEGLIKVRRQRQGQFTTGVRVHLDGMTHRGGGDGGRTDKSQRGFTIGTDEVCRSE